MCIQIITLMITFIMLIVAFGQLKAAQESNKTAKTQFEAADKQYATAKSLLDATIRNSEITKEQLKTINRQLSIKRRQQYIDRIERIIVRFEKLQTYYHDVINNSSNSDNKKHFGHYLLYSKAYQIAIIALDGYYDDTTKGLLQYIDIKPDLDESDYDFLDKIIKTTKEIKEELYGKTKHADLIELCKQKGIYDIQQEINDKYEPYLNKNS